jgi:ATP-dependent DNA helicase RecG
VNDEEAAMASSRRQDADSRGDDVVGVDVPNAVLMTIEGGERFGLSQLHQLPGRIVRGTHPGFYSVCEAVDAEGLKRLEAFVASNDGFNCRGRFQTPRPGDLLGTKLTACRRSIADRV